MKRRSTFFHKEMLDKIIKNAEGSDFLRETLEKVKKWEIMTDDQIWELMYCSEIPRAAMVLSYGWCPSCRQTVHMSGWKIDPFNKPWKVTCPNCNEAFPKNDFHKFYLSGLDKKYKFSYKLADKSLLYNEEAPDPNDPKHMFGVDDGHGYREKEPKDPWMFVGAYIEKGIWDQVIWPGVLALGRAYAMTGNGIYAHKCGILLDRIADLFPDFDYYEQGHMYEEVFTSRGYVSYWCDSSLQLREMLMSYDMIFETIREDKELASFLIKKSKKYKTPYRKESFFDIQKNIENRIFGDASSNRWKFEANYPWADEFITFTKIVLSRWPDRKEDMADGVYKTMWWVAENDPVIIMEKVTRADGLSGEKGVQAYSAIAMREMARILSIYSLFDKSFLKKMITKYPKFLRGLKLYINAWFLNAHYPGSGDCGYLNAPTTSIPFPPGYVYFTYTNPECSIVYSFEGFLWNLYELTGDVDLIRLMYNSAGCDMKKCFTTDYSLSGKPEDLQKKMIALMEEKGSELKQESTNYEEWKLAVLHSGTGGNKRGLYLDYDSGGPHGHNDGMNMGFFAKGQNLLPDYGYPPVHRPGGWASKFFYWYRSAAAHNTVIIDGREHRDYCYVQRDINGGQGLISESGKTVLWGIGRSIKAVAVDDPLIPGNGAARFERLLAMVDIDDTDCYYFDVFRVTGGKKHVKLMRGAICDIEFKGLDLVPYPVGHDPYGMFFITDKNEAENFHYETDPDFKFIRNTRIDRKPSKDWSAEWKYSDKYKGYFGSLEGKDIRLKYRDLTYDAQAVSFDSFFDIYYATAAKFPERLKDNKVHPEEMLPSVAVMREGTGPLMSDFVGIYEPSDGEGKISSIKRLDATDRNTGRKAGTAVVAEIMIRDGSCDLLIAADVQNKCTLAQKEWDVETDASLCMVRKKTDGLYDVTMMKGSFFRCGGFSIKLDNEVDVYEASFCR
jgi:oligo-alginate lyase